MIGLVSCCGPKLSIPAPARYLYTSPLFVKSLAYAEARCDFVYVISAKHHLVELDQVLDPYDQVMAPRKRERNRWGLHVASSIEHRHGRDIELMVLAGNKYVRPLIGAMAWWWGNGEFRQRIAQPLLQLYMGERLQWLNAQLAAM